MPRQRALPHADPEAPHGPLRRAILRLLGSGAMAALEGSLPFRVVAWRTAPLLMRLSGGRAAILLPFPAGVIETRDARNGRPHRRVVVYFHDGERVTVSPPRRASMTTRSGTSTPWRTRTCASKPSRSGPRRSTDEQSLARLWELADRAYPPCATYRRRAARGGRTIPILQLVPR